MIVPGEGNPKARWAIVGEAPGEEEARQQRPFVGRTGQAQDGHLERNRLRRRDGWLTNLVKVYHEGNPDPSPEDVEHWGPELIKELRRVAPRVIFSAGRLSTRYLLGWDADLDAVHGVPQIPRRELRDLDCVIIPGYHPAAAFYAPDTLQFISYDYHRFAAAVRGEISLRPVEDTHPNPVYEDLSLEIHPGRRLDEVLSWGHDVALDTEGWRERHYSFQLSTRPGHALVVHSGTGVFDLAIDRLRRHFKRKHGTAIFHNAPFDVEMLIGMGLDLLDLEVPLFDSMMAAYLMCVEPQSMKALARRWCGMEMKEYEEVIGDVAKQKQLDFLEMVMGRDWPEVEPRIVHENDGTVRIYKPKHIAKVAESILVDVYSGKETKEGPADPLKRWKKVDRVQRKLVEARLGPMPVGDLSMVPRPDAVYYAGRDSDATLRLCPILTEQLKQRGLTDLMKMKMAMLPAAIRIRMEGLLGERKRFEDLSERMWDEMDRRREKLSSKFFGGAPINPASGDQIATLMRRRGLKGAKKTKTGKMSTSKKSIEHLRFTDEAIELVEQWREHQKVRDSFAEPVLEHWPEGEEFTLVRTDLKLTRVASGRFSASILDDVPSAPLLAIPQRTEVGKMVRACYVAEPGYVLGSWDLDQAEMRMIADESKDPVMVKLFIDGKRDIHTDTASKIFGKRYEDIENDKKLRKALRDPSKRVGFGVATGITEHGLFDQLRMAGAVQENGSPWDIRSCALLIKEWFRIYKGVPPYFAWCKQTCRDNGGWIADRWGMLRPLPAIFDEDELTRLEAERQTHSHRIQGGAQGMLQRSMAWAYRELKSYGDLVKWKLQIHDEMILAVIDDEDIRAEVDRIMVEALTKHGAKLIVPVKSSGSYADNWGGLK